MDAETWFKSTGKSQCGPTGKQIFPTLESARGALAHMRGTKGKGSKRVQSGKCPFCQGYHLTSGQRGR